MTLVALMSSVSLFAQDVLRYEGQWPRGEGVLYSSKDGLIIGTFDNAVPNGKCVAYLPSGDVYWGDYKDGEATGYGCLYRNSGAIFSGQFKDGRYHGLDTLYRKNGSVLVGAFSYGRLKARLYEATEQASGLKKPEYPKIDLTTQQEEFLKSLEVAWEEKTLRFIEDHGYVTPRFQGGTVEDFTLWVNSQVVVPESFDPTRGSRTVLVEFTVLSDGSLADIHAVFGSNIELNQAAEKAVAKSPIWEPGVFDGKKRDTRLTVPVVFEGE